MVKKSAKKCVPLIAGGMPSDGKTRGGTKYKESAMAPFARHFRERLFYLRECLRRLEWIRKYANDELKEGVWQQDIEVYERMIVVMLRTFCCESKREKKNYTIQNFISRQRAGLDSDIEYIEGILNEDVFKDLQNRIHSLRDSIKIVTDHYLCHADNFERYNLDGEIGLQYATWTESNSKEIMELMFKGGEKSCINRLVSAIGNVFARISIVDSVM